MLAAACISPYCHACTLGHARITPEAVTLQNRDQRQPAQAFSTTSSYTSSQNKESICHWTAILIINAGDDGDIAIISRFEIIYGFARVRSRRYLVGVIFGSIESSATGIGQYLWIHRNIAA